MSQIAKIGRRSRRRRFGLAATPSEALEIIEKAETWRKRGGDAETAFQVIEMFGGFEVGGAAEKYPPSGEGDVSARSAAAARPTSGWGQVGGLISLNAFWNC